MKFAVGFQGIKQIKNSIHNFIPVFPTYVTPKSGKISSQQIY